METIINVKTSGWKFKEVTPESKGTISGFNHLIFEDVLAFRLIVRWDSINYNATYLIVPELIIDGKINNILGTAPIIHRSFSNVRFDEVLMYLLKRIDNTFCEDITNDNPNEGRILTFVWNGKKICNINIFTDYNIIALESYSNDVNWKLDDYDVFSETITFSKEADEIYCDIEYYMFNLEKERLYNTAASIKKIHKVKPIK